VTPRSARRTRIAFVGEPRWARMLAAELEAAYPDVVSARHHTAADGRSPWRKLWLLASSDVLVRVGALPDFRTRRDRLWLAAGRHRLPRLRIVTYWMGTDVLRLLERAVSGNLPSAELACFNAWTNLAGADRLTEELRSVGVDGRTAPFPGAVIAVPDEIAPMPAQMTVLSYVPDHRREFYGLPALLAAAETLPDVRFRIAGGGGAGLTDIPENVEFLGFVDDMASVYREASCVVRLVPHDGAAMSVGEGLLAARPVIYSYPVPHTAHVPYGDTPALIAELERLRALHTAGGIPLNAEGRSWALVDYDQKRRLAILLEALLGA